jgi:hypothetical protein
MSPHHGRAFNEVQHTRQKQLGYVKEFTVVAPSLHTSEESHWDLPIHVVNANGMI